jgi:predicted  nucleic acid-binding Zn-ribbon protein
MARGWESKSVEQQQDAAVASRGEKKVRLTPEQVATQRQLQALELSLNRTRQQLDAASNPRHRQMLESAVAHLEDRIKDLMKPGSKV